jgi:hypothetical protein
MRDDQTDPKTSETDYELSRRRVLAGAAAAGGALALGGLTTVGAADREPTVFTVRVANISDQTGTTLDPSGDASSVPVVLSPGAYAVHRRGEPVFSGPGDSQFDILRDGEPERFNGLEEVAEDGNPGPLVASLSENDRVTSTGAFTTPVGASAPGPLPPGMAYEFEVEAESPAQYLSLVTMFVQSNDLFYALGGASGLELFDGLDPVDGDVTEHVGLWDAGTEINEEPGVGENQAPRQRAAGVGLVERGLVAPIETVNGYDYPPVENVLEVTISSSM